MVAVAYTAMHGVAGAVLERAFAAADLPAPMVVGSQFEPDAAFPSVSFPNPEEPGAMDRVVELAADRGAAVALANDPDGDRLGVAVPQSDGSWRRLGGDEIGWLLADHVLGHTAGDDRLVVTTLVSSSLLGVMAADHGVQFAETFTGFKWIGRAILDRPELRCVFAYEQALGYLVAPRPLDKDGISAAVLMAEIAALAEAEGTSVQGRLDDAGRPVRPLRDRRALGADGAGDGGDAGPPAAAGAADRAGRARGRRRGAVPGGQPAAPRAGRRHPPAGPPERHRTQGQALRRSHRPRPHPRPPRPPRCSFSSVFSSHQRTQIARRTVSIAASAAARRR